MSFPKAFSETRWQMGDNDKVDMVVHEAIGPYGNTCDMTPLGQEA